MPRRVPGGRLMPLETPPAGTPWHEDRYCPHCHAPKPTFVGMCPRCGVPRCAAPDCADACDT